VKSGPKRIKLKPEVLFWLKVWPRGDCWEWRANRNGRDYGTVLWGGRAAGGSNGPGQYAHRHAFELAKGTIPPGMEIDHLCLHRWCVRPSHLEAVSRRVNNERKLVHYQRKRTCKRGHAITGSNAKPCSDGYFTCRICAKASWDRCMQRKRR
jgi:HNH endonuclease